MRHGPGRGKADRRNALEISPLLGEEDEEDSKPRKDSLEGHEPFALPSSMICPSSSRQPHSSALNASQISSHTAGTTGPAGLLPAPLVQKKSLMKCESDQLTSWPQALQRLWLDSGKGQVPPTALV